jgi:hypothetical protein
MVPPLAALVRGDSARGKLADPRRVGSRYGRGIRLAARLSTWPPTVMPICAISPAAWMAVVTSSGPLGGADGRLGSLGGGSGGGGGVGRAARRWAFSAAAAREAAVERVASGLGFAAGLGFATGFARGLLESARRPIRCVRVDGRLASTPASAAADFLVFFAFAGLSVI